MERHRNKYTSSSILGLHSRVTEGKTKNWVSQLARQLAIAIMKAFHYSVVMRRFSSCETKIVKNEAKLSIFETVFVPSYQLYLCMVMEIW